MIEFLGVLLNIMNFVAMVIGYVWLVCVIGFVVLYTNFRSRYKETLWLMTIKETLKEDDK